MNVRILAIGKINYSNKYIANQMTIYSNIAQLDDWFKHILFKKKMDCHQAHSLQVAFRN